MTGEKYIGLDVHQATISVAVMDSKGKVVMESILETKATTILEFLAGLRGTLSVTFEEGTWAAWLYDLLKPHVANLVVCNPRKNALLKHGNKSLSDKENLSHNLGTWLTPGKRSFRFDDAGVVSLLCNLHPEMTGFIMISPTPYYTITDKSGAYKIENVPEGHYTLTAWHEGAKGQSKRVTVSENTKVNFTL